MFHASWCVLFYFSFIWLHVFAFAFKSNVHCGSALESGASELPYYCTPLVCVPAVIGALAVWQQNIKYKKMGGVHFNFLLPPKALLHWHRTDWASLAAPLDLLINKTSLRSFRGRIIDFVTCGSTMIVSMGQVCTLGCNNGIGGFHENLWFLLSFMTGNSWLEPLLKDLFAQIHFALNRWGFGKNRTGDLRITQHCQVPRCFPLS